MSFISENYISIIVLSILIFGSLIVFAIFKDKLTNSRSFVNLNNLSVFNNNNSNKNTPSRIVNVETFDNDTSSHSEAFCKKYQPQPHKMKEHCKNLGVRGCHIPRCCVLLDGKECVPGDSNGPSFRTQNGKPLNAKYFMFQGKCSSLGGKCPNN